MFEFLILVLFPGFVILAATMDMFTMTIPNRLCLALVAAFFLAVPFADMAPMMVGVHVLTAAGTLVLTFILFASGVFGGGDAKLTAAIMLWLGPSLALDFAILTALFGGALTIGLVMMRTDQFQIAAARVPWAARLLSPEIGIPYGIALSAAAMVVFTSSPWFARAVAL